MEVRYSTLYNTLCAIEEDYKILDCDDLIAEILFRIGNVYTEEGISKLFKLYDDDNSDSISFFNIARIARESGIEITKEEINDILEIIGDGETINRQQLIDVLNSGKSC